MADDGETSSSSSMSYFIYDVFLSFRGDTRHGFTDHLFKALVNRGIKAFRDDPSLRFGDEIRPTLLEAIERSRMSIVVFSQGYASSPWCLDELVKIVECKDKGRRVFPIFYHVEPSDVRYQKNQYETDMRKYENGRNTHKVQAWRSALSAVGNLSGTHCNGERSETDVINKICEDILKYLPRETLHIKHPVELDSRFEEVKSLLDIESHHTLFMLCIYGDGGTDKISFVVALCNMVSNEFEGPSYLLENVSTKSKERGVEDLQKTLISMIDRKEKTEIGSTHRGCFEIQQRLRNRRVLLILHDVDSIEQLKSLAGGPDWFGLGSRIIITTRNEDVANMPRLNDVEIKKYCIDECDVEGMVKMDVEEGDIVGFDDSLRIVINQLKEEDSLRNVVSITGMGGLGKTTLAQMVYNNNNEVKKLFPCRAWSCVSKDFRGRKVFLDILCCLNPSTSEYENLSEQELKKRVKECLNKKKYLVVLDDIWEPEVWDKVKDVFPKNNNGSMILITSRNDEVARYTLSRHPHHRLPPLDAGKSWELFCRKVFGGEECPHCLEPIGRSIIERCGGLPLAIITLAGLVAKKERSHIEWSKIEGSVPWYLAKDPTKVINVLKVSYDNLPKYLKPCFIYFGIYPEDYTLFARELIQLWMAEGFIQPEKIRTSKVPRPEDVGEDYLNELVDRNLVHVVERRSDGGAKICRIHDLLRELCILESKVDSLEVRPEFTNNSLSNSGKLCLLCNEPYYMSVFKGSPFTYSLFFFAGARNYADYIPELFSSCQVVHVARGVNFTKCPCDFTKMIHLKYLRIAAGPHTRSPPACIWSLRNLETLDLRGWQIVSSRISIWKLERLRHLYVRFHVELEVGADIKPMWNLQILSQIWVDQKAVILFYNGCFPNLTKLSLSHNSSLHPDFLHQQLLNQHHFSKLRTFKINFCATRISLDGIVFPSNISKITFTNFNGLDPSCMIVLGRITSLRSLKLVNFNSQAAPETLNCGTAAGDFPQLQVFHLVRLSYLKRLTIENGAMPQLRHMVIRGCYDLVEIPERLLSLSETDVINKICEDILKYLPRETLHIKHPVEPDSRFEEVKSLLDIESHDTSFMLRIYGDGETDKTSFVGELCNMIFHKFEVARLHENVSEKSKESIRGLEKLQKALLSMIDHEEKTEIGSTQRGCLEIKRRLRSRRVLLILDDIDSIEQLESLAGGHDWFGLGSRIIITTRNEDVANMPRLNDVEIKKYCIDECDVEGMGKMDVEEGDIVGFDGSLRTVIDQLKEEDSLRNVVSITGMGGLGKTALARMIYNNDEIKKLFPCRAWCCVTKDYNGSNVLLSFLCCLKPSTSRYGKFSEERLKEEVRKCLNRNKYLIVLDDIWEPEVWDKVKAVFPNNNNGSMILITSRNDAVARYTRSRSPHHQLPRLDLEVSWELFCRKVFGKEECPLYLKPTGRSIVERCGGLPIAIITIAGLVAKEERAYMEWSRIKGFVPWYLAEDSSKVMDVLKVSYDNLPETLKPCFRYFGIFPEDNKIPARELIQLWMVEGFIQPEKIATSKVPQLEDVGDKYLKELVDRNLVQVVERRSDGGVKTCRIHDLLHELCILESKADNFLEVCTESTMNSLSNSCRLSLLCNEQHYMSLIKGSQPSTRSLFFFAGERYPDYTMENFPLVHVLHVAEQVPFEKDPRDLMAMIHLKYLRIEKCNCPRGIPDWIWSLTNLETLDLRGWISYSTTISIWKLERLKHLYISFFAKLEADKVGANNKRMMNLQTLTTVSTEEQTMLPINNGSFPNLTKLGLMYSPRHKRLLRGLQGNLYHLRRLRTLNIKWTMSKISLDGIVFPPNISKITLTDFAELDSGCMSALGRITSLQILKLTRGSTATDTLNVGAAPGDFPQLQVFHIDMLFKVKRLLTLENGAMPRLQRMVIRDCKDLKEVPERLLSLCDKAASNYRAKNSAIIDQPFV